MRALDFGDGHKESPFESNNSMFSPNGHNPTQVFTRFRYIHLIVAVLLGLAILSCVTEDDLTADQRIYQLSQQLMCPVCDGQTLDQSQAQLSEDMKAVIRTKIEDGETNAEIRAYFVDRYGEIVLASPEAGGFNVIAWVVPGLIFIAGALLVGNAYLNMRRRGRLAGETNTGHKVVRTGAAADEADLEEYIERADREMASALRVGSANQDADTESEGKG